MIFEYSSTRNQMRWFCGNQIKSDSTYVHAMRGILMKMSRFLFSVNKWVLHRIQRYNVVAYSSRGIISIIQGRSMWEKKVTECFMYRQFDWMNQRQFQSRDSRNSHTLLDIMFFVVWQNTRWVENVDEDEFIVRVCLIMSNHTGYE